MICGNPQVTYLSRVYKGKPHSYLANVNAAWYVLRIALELSVLAAHASFERIIFSQSSTEEVSPCFQLFWNCKFNEMFEGVSKSFRTGRLERELQMVQLSATRCSCIAILWVSLANFAAITLCVASQRVFFVFVYFVIDSVRKLLDTPSYAQSFLRS
jgi:hypothetical protein